MKPSSIYEEKKLRCTDCGGVVDECVDCGRKFNKTDEVYCILHHTFDDSYYIHLCKDCAVKEKGEK